MTDKAETSSRDIKRAIEMLKVASYYIRDMEPWQTHFYDECECDYMCIADDLQNAAEGLEASHDNR